MLVCPVGVVESEFGNNAAKCDLCAGREIPACVENCPNEALVLVDGITAATGVEAVSVEAMIGDE